MVSDMVQASRVLLIDTRRERCAALEDALCRACVAISPAVGQVTVESKPAESRKAQDYDVVVIHYQSDRGHAEGLNLAAKSGPQVIKFGGDGEQEESGECRTRVHAIYPAVAAPPDGPGQFGRPEVWSKVLLFALGNSADKPAELSARPVDSCILATWFLLKGYALARGFLAHQEIEALATSRSRRWQDFTPIEKEEYWKPLAGATVALGEARLSLASALIAETLTKVEPEKESVLAAVEEVVEFLRRKGYGRP